MLGLCAPPRPHGTQPCDACLSSDVPGISCASICSDRDELVFIRARAIAILSGEKCASMLWTMSFAAPVDEAAR